MLKRGAEVPEASLQAGAVIGEFQVETESWERSWSLRSRQYSILNGPSPAASLGGPGLDFISQAIWIPYSIKPKSVAAKGDAMLRIGTTGKSGAHENSEEREIVSIRTEMRQKCGRTVTFEGKISHLNVRALHSSLESNLAWMGSSARLQRTTMRPKGFLLLLCYPQGRT